MQPPHEAEKGRYELLVDTPGRYQRKFGRRAVPHGMAASSPVRFDEGRDFAKRIEFIKANFCETDLCLQWFPGLFSSCWGIRAFVCALPASENARGDVAWAGDRLNPEIAAGLDSVWPKEAARNAPGAVRAV